MIKAIFFDVGGVLISGTPGLARKRLARLLHISGGVLPYGVYKADWDRLMEGKVSEVEFCLRVCKKLQACCPPRKVLSPIFRRQVQKANRAVVRIARQLQNHGYIVGVISNTSRSHIQDYRRLLNGTMRFQPAILSHQVGVKKPKLRIFKLARQKSGVRFSEIIFFDDQESNVIAAKKLGIKAFVYRNPAQLVRQLRRFGVKI